MAFRSSNPVFRSINRVEDISDGKQATYSGVALKSVLLTGIIALVAFLSVGLIAQNPDSLSTYIVFVAVSAIIGFIACLVGCRSTRLAMPMSIVYATCEGLLLGFSSLIYTLYYGNGIVPTALLCTLITVTVMLGLFASGIVKVTRRFRSIMFTALIVLVVCSLVWWILSLFGVNFLGTNFWLYLGVSVITTIIAALYLFIDFDNIKMAVENGISKKYEWMLSLGLMVTIVWLYVEILRLVAIIWSRSDN